MTTSNLSGFISHARSKGMDHQTIRMLLLSSGWKEKDIAEALASGTLEMPIPLPSDAGSARDAFFHLLSFTSLTASVVSAIFLFFDYLNRLLPDPAFRDYYYNGNDYSSLRWELAILLVSFPLFIWMSRLLNKEFARHPEKLGSAVRRWLTYLTLFVTACTLIGDGIALIFSLLEGEVTLRFLLKVLTILVLTGLPFMYYLNAMRLGAERYSRSPIHAGFRLASILIVAFAVVTGFIIAGSPSYGRAERFDEQRLTDLRAIQSEVFNVVYGPNQYFPEPPATLPRELPKTLEDVAANATYQKLALTDPETGAPYEYRVISAIGFDLCATFSLPRDLQYDIFWNHPAGHHCFTVNALEPNIR